MVRLIQFLLTLVTASVRSRLSLQAENAVLRNQLFLYGVGGELLFKLLWGADKFLGSESANGICST